MSVERQLRVLEGERRGDGATCLRIAFATSDLRRVNQHFGSAERFAIYSVGPAEATLLEVAEFGKLAQDGHEGKLLEKFVVLDGCAAVYCQAVGGSAVRQLLALGVQPLKVPAGSGIAGLITQVQKEFDSGAAGWVARALETRARQASRFDVMAEEGWSE